MSMKSVDLQFALHKNDEAGLRQNQLAQKMRQDEALLENQAVQETERESRRSAKVEQSGASGIRSDDKPKQDQRNNGKPRKGRAEESGARTATAQAPDHPYKGHHIDLSL
ncbi:hypothetical protein B5M42_002915 [Paenibacillus athensensis]|uniref:Uncharacterized protein n=1 Tax=Paenibacillus athensensis TaxID=1967502 RepID=A0A4Y8QA54_9BACL|nr:hypothetical protein [Paenibacillus athensensis]MCD1257792.1 hypothetical protein [Paenibacillus athensensis]